MTVRLAILADIHANVWALDAVLEHAKGRGVDAFVNLGDTLYGPLKPHATYERLMHETVLVTIQGNQDRLIYEASERDLAHIPTLAYVIRDLGEEPIHWLSGLPKTATLGNDVSSVSVAFWLLVPGKDRLSLVLSPIRWDTPTSATATTNHTPSTTNRRRTQNLPTPYRTAVT